MLEIPGYIPDIPVFMDVVPVNVLALLGLYVLDSHSLLPDNIPNRPWNRIIVSQNPVQFIDEWSVQTMRAGDHLYVPLKAPLQSFYTVAQLRKIHKQFAHLAARRLYELLKTAGIGAVTPKSLDKLEYIAKTCEPCQRIRNAPHRFRVTLGAENTRFNSKVYMDFVYIDGQPVLYKVDEATRFPEDPFVSPMTTESVWETILKLWATVYTGIPNKLVFDEGSQFCDAIVEI